MDIKRYQWDVLDYIVGICWDILWGYFMEHRTNNRTSGLLPMAWLLVKRGPSPCGVVARLCMGKRVNTHGGLI